MTPSKGPNHVVVDGSNIATEGRNLPSLAQLSEAVMSFMEEYPNTSITVVVDATFGHRIDKKESKEFEEGISNNELVAPPAGAVGRGDAFVLSIAQKANASILSNDSFQEFHGDYEWLFDEGRLIGGKPVPHVGWVFVDRVPVRGPVSRKATGGSRGGGGRRSSKKETGESKRSGRKTSVEASGPMPVPKSPPPGRAVKSAAVDQETAPTRAQRSTPKAGETVNDLMAFLEFVEHHPVGTSVNGTVESYSSHGAYIAIGENGVRGYVPMRLMSDPPPTSARKVMKLGEAVTLVVVSFAPLRRSIDCALPDMAAKAIADAAAELAAEGDAVDEPTAKPSRRTSRPKRSKAAEAETRADDDTLTAASSDRGATRASAKKTAAKRQAKKPAPKKAAVKKVPAKKAPAKKTAAKKTAAKKTAAKKTASRKTAAKPASATTNPVEKPPVKKAPAKKSAAKKTPAKKTRARKTAAKKAPAKKTAAKRTASKQTTTQKAPAKKAPAAASGD